MKLWKNACLVLVSLLYWACSDSGVNADGEKSSTQKYFFLSPNVHQLCDSVDERISKEGVRTRLSPGGKYTLVAFNDSLDVEPLLFIDGVKCCENGCRGTRNGDSLQFSFSCKLDEPMYAILSLKDLNGDFIKNPFHNVLLEGMGVYSDHLSLNLIVAGSFDSTADGETIDSLAKKIGQSIQEIFEVHVDTVYVSYANEHPKVGHLYPMDSVVFVQSLDDVNNLSYPWNNYKKDSSFDIVLVDKFLGGSHIGQAKMFFTQLNVYMAVIAVAFRNPFDSLQNSNVIQQIVAHEFGHVLGLDHTTLTWNDVQNGDYSRLEDGLEDTPYCQYLMDRNKERIKSLKKENAFFYDDVIKYFSSLPDDLGSDEALKSVCPDYLNIMYGVGSGRESSPMQRAIVKKNLTLIPH